MKRLLITGSRNWDDPIKLSLHFGQALGYLHTPLDEITVVHGNASRGVDAAVESISQYYRYKTERCPANWTAWGSSAGFFRNQDMVARGADLCLAFIAACEKQSCPLCGAHGSHGTLNCADLAEKAGIETWRFYTSDSLGVSTVPPLGSAQTA